MELLEALKKETGEEKTTNGSPEKRRLQEVKGAIEAVNLEARERVDRLTTSVEKTLQEFQLAVLDGFQPEPVRKTRPGGKRSELEIEALTRVLETIHQAPGLRYRTLRERMIERLLERLRAHGPAYNPANEVELRVYLRTTLDQVRMLNSDDFQLRKGAISRELKETLLQKSAECSRQEKIRNFLLSRPALAILEERLNRGSFP
jgi:hypothetical protein